MSDTETPIKVYVKKSTPTEESSTTSTSPPEESNTIIYDIITENGIVDISKNHMYSSIDNRTDASLYSNTIKVEITTGQNKEIISCRVLS